MAERLPRLVGTNKISEDFDKINQAFTDIEIELDDTKDDLDDHKSSDVRHWSTADRNKMNGIEAGAQQNTVDSVAGRTGDVAITWSDVTNRPVSQVTDVDDAVTKRHTHPNKAILDAVEKPYTTAEQTKLSGLQPGAQVNQHAFAQVNNLEADDPQDTLTVDGGTGITVSTNPVSKTVTITATGTATPGAHGSSHLEFGSDPIPFATTSNGGLMSAGDKTKQETIETKVTSIESDLHSVNMQHEALKRGLNVISSPSGGSMMPEVDGTTRVNLLGSAGGFESLTPFTINGAATLSTEQKRSGTNSLKIIANSSAVNAYRDIPYKLDSAKQYLLAGWVYVESRTGGTIPILLCDYGSNTARYTAAPNTSLLGSWQFVYTKVPTASTITTDGFRLRIGSISSDIYTAYFDDIRLYEVTPAQYTAIGTTITPTSAPSIDEVWPYVDSVQHLRNPVIIKRGRNQFPPFTDRSWTLHATAVVTEPYTLTLNATGPSQQCVVTLSAVASTTYYFTSAAHTARTAIETISSSGATTHIQTTTNAASYTVTTLADTVAIRFTFTSGTVGSGTHILQNPMLSFDSLPFEPRNDDYLITQCILASSADGSVRDQLYFDGGQARKLKKFQTDITLDGSWSWQESVTDYFSGYKRTGTIIPSPNPSPKEDVQQVVKHNGQVLGHTAVAAILWPHADLARVTTTNGGTLYITVSDIDSGWDDNYTPSAAEVSSYFNGWKVNGYTVGTTVTAEESGQVAASGAYILAQSGKKRSVAVTKSIDNTTFTAATHGIDYSVSLNSSGTTATLTNISGSALYYKITYTYGVTANSWVSVVDGITAPSTNTIAYVSANRALSYTPYSLSYQLAAPVVELVTVEGAISLHSGSNLVDVGEGVVYQELTVPRQHSSDFGWYINEKGLSGNVTDNPFVYKAKSIVTVYKNGADDTANWRISQNTANTNGVYARIPNDLYDPTAIYTVSYVPEYFPQTSNIVDITASSPGNVATNVAALNQQMADTITKDSVQDWLLLQDGAYLVNLRRDIGVLPSLNTTDKATIIAAINEVVALKATTAYVDASSGASAAVIKNQMRVLSMGGLV